MGNQAQPQMTVSKHLLSSSGVIPERWHSSRSQFASYARSSRVEFARLLCCDR